MLSKISVFILSIVFTCRVLALVILVSVGAFGFGTGTCLSSAEESKPQIPPAHYRHTGALGWGSIPVVFPSDLAGHQS